MGRPQDPTIRPRLLGEIQEAMQGSTLSSVTFRGLAGELGLSTYSLSYHFGSRAELIDAILEGAIRARAELLGDQDLSALSRAEMRAFLRDGYPLTLEAPYAAGVRMQFEAGALERIDPDMGQRIADSHAAWATQFARWFEAQGLDAARAAVGARALIDAFFGTQFGFVLTDDRDAAVAATELAVEALMAHLLGPEPA